MPTESGCPLCDVRGFTLVELLIALAVASLLAALVAPSWREQLAAGELRERADALVAAMAQARSEAIKRGARVDLCPSADRSTCAPSGEWEAGWLAYPNEAAVDPQGPVANAVVRDRGARAGITIRGNSPVAHYVSYTSLGHARRHDGALQMGTFTVCRHGSSAIKVVLANSGRARVDATTEACP
jgi:type IV fimbrial biogenesis protein FimT